MTSILLGQDVGCGVESVSAVAASEPLASPASPPSSVEVRSLKAARREAINRFEIEYVRAVLAKSDGNVTRAAAIADVSRQVIHKLIAKHRLAQRSSTAG